MVGLQATAIKTQLGSLLNGIVVYDFWLPWAGFASDEGREFVLFCGAGWRSALAAKTLQDMGMRNVAHIDGGFTALKAAAGAPLVSMAEHQAESVARKSH